MRDTIKLLLVIAGFFSPWCWLIACCIPARCRPCQVKRDIQKENDKIIELKNYRRF